MEPGSAKRRKIGHSRGESAVGNIDAAASSGLSRGRAFILEAEELVDQVKLDYATALQGVDSLLHKIKGSIEAIEAHDALQIADAATKLEKKHKIQIPFPEPRPSRESNYKVAFAKPCQFNVVGSYVSKTMIRAQKSHAVDMVVVIPGETLQEKDYLDLRYFYKRAYFLAVVAAALQKDLADDGELSYEYLNGNPLCPVLSLKPKVRGETKEGRLDYRVRIIPCAPDNFFPKSKLHLGATLVRKAGDDDESKVATKPTPFYNSTVVSESCFFPYLKLLRQTEKKCAAFNKACILGRVWLQQRGLGSDMADGGFGHFEWTVLLALLLQSGDNTRGHAPLSTSLSATQLFKAMVQFLAVTNLSEKPCVLGTATVETETAGPVLWDAARGLNVAFKMSNWSAGKLHQHAKWTRSLLNDSTADQFTPTFILRADLPWQNYDLIAHLKYDAKQDKTEPVDCRGRLWEYSDKAYRVLRRALQDEELGERARSIHLQLPKSSSWELAKKPSTRQNHTIEIGVLFNAANMTRAVDRGPAAGPSTEEKEECAKFQRFWGEKSELRRFEGDSIRETLIWSSTSAFDLCEEIMRYILKLHLGVGYLEDELTFYGDGFTELIPIKTTDTSVFNAARKAFSSFEKDMRNLDDMPLHVRQIAPICPELRHASVKVPFSTVAKSGPRPLECVISFEASGKWPESIVAIQRTKIAFLRIMGDLLERSKPGEVRSYVGLESSTTTNTELENLAYLDIVYESGPAFRLRIHSDLEEALLTRQSHDKTIDQHHRHQASVLLSNFRRLYYHLPLHTQSINTFATRFPALSPTIRLLKHWFSSHKLSSHFTPEFIELVALHVFLCPYPWDKPSSPSVGLLRALLFLSRWDWRSEPLIVDTNGDMPSSERSAISTRLEAWRKIDPLMNHTVLFVATAQESSGVAYTTVNGVAQPSKVVAARMTALAKTACRVIREEGVELDARRLFVPSTREYDVLLHLSPKALKGVARVYPSEDLLTKSSSGSGSSKYKNLSTTAGQDPLPLPAAPVDTLFERLEAIYGSGSAAPLVFFRGGGGGGGGGEDDKVVGAIWNPTITLSRRSFKVNLGTSYKPVVVVGAGKKRKGGDGDEDGEENEKEEQLVEVNREAILSEIARIGGDILEKVEVQMG
ncbi:Nrap protein [Pseudoneurospora amorphoporcata]|uniref:U3 small nucleolar RNA-associated protein 22 n=1 Tax=Pseudoneurospora amorphoporcata TaxID=241081 RepID=A0AAN6SFL4_9PEZI|nr:Nrap protein [Pseudoneurospora amorphoporcata]